MDASVAIRDLKAFDPAALRMMLHGSELDLTLLDGAAPFASVVPFCHDDVVFCSIEVHSRIKGRLAAAHDQVMLGCMQAADPSRAWLAGEPLESGCMFFIDADAVVDFSFDADTRLTVMSLPLQRLRSYFRSDTRLQQLAHLSGRRHPVLQLYSVALAHRISTGSVTEDEVDGWLAAVARALAAPDEWVRNECLRSRRTRYLVFRRAEDFMRQHLRRDIYMQELCEVTGVSERALRYAFVEMVGVAPGRFLTMLRLCEACKHLSSAGAGRKSVKSIALSCGLWDLSRFAESYRRVFGELPRQTLMRSTALDS